MGLCWHKLLTSPEEDLEEDNHTAIDFAVPISEISRNAAATSILVITHSYFKFSAIAVGENDSSTLSQ